MMALSKASTIGGILTGCFMLVSCAGVTQERLEVIQAVQPDCSVTQTEIHSKDGKIDSVKQTSPGNAAIDKCAATHIEAARKSIAFRALATAFAATQSVKPDPVIAAKFVQVLDNAVPDIRDAASKALEDRNVAEADVRKAAFAGEMEKLVSDALNPDSSVGIIAAYDGKTYPKLDPRYVQSAIDGALKKKGLDIGQVRTAFADSHRVAPGPVEMQCSGRLDPKSGILTQNCGSFAGP